MDRSPHTKDLGPARRALAKDPAWDYGAMLPLARERQSGAYAPAIPGFARDLAIGALDLLEGPRTGEMTPEALSALTALPAAGVAPAGSLGVMLGRRAQGFPHGLADSFISAADSQLADPETLVSAMMKAKLVPTLHDDLGVALAMPEMNMKWNPSSKNLPDRLGGIDDLLTAYPELEALKLQPSFLPKGVQGSYHADENTIRYNPASEFTEKGALPVVRHELQHAIQRIEGTPGGTNLGVAERSIEDAAKNLYTQTVDSVDPKDHGDVLLALEAWLNESGWPLKPAQQEWLNRFQNNPSVVEAADLVRVLGGSPMSAYMREVGEQEARAVMPMGKNIPFPIYDDFVQKIPLVADKGLSAHTRLIPTSRGRWFQEYKK